MTRVHDPKTGRIVNVDEDQLKDWKAEGWRVVKGAVDSDDAKASSSSTSKSK